MALKVYDTLEPQGNYPAVKAEHVQMPDGSRLSEFDAGQNGAELATFDLAALGLSAVPLMGGTSVLQTNTAEIMAAFDNGPVAFVIPFDVGGATLNVTVVMNSASVNGTYQAVSLVNYAAPGTVTLIVEGSTIMVKAAMLRDDVAVPTPTSIDLSGFESEGKIVETFADGSTEITVMEFDADGKPTKITDGSGNVTVLTW